MKRYFSCLLALCSILLIHISGSPLIVFAAQDQPYSVTEYHASATIVSKNSLNVRSGPSTDYQILTSLATGTEITIIGKTDNDWYQIQLDHQVGFVSAKYVSTPIEIEEIKEDSESNGFIDNILSGKLPEISMINTSFLKILVISIIAITVLMIVTLAEVISLTREISDSRSFYENE